MNTRPARKGSPMQVKSVEQATAAYALKSLKAYLDGEQNLKWIIGIIGCSASAREMLLGLSGYGRPERYRELSDCLGSTGL